MNYIISQYLVFEKNDQGGILPETRWSRRTRLYNEGRAEALSNWKEYDNDTRALTQLNNALQNNGQTITDNAERQKIADKTLKNASERAKEYGNQIVANTKTLSDFKKENEVEDPNKQVKPKFTDGLKSFASSALSSIGNAVVSAGTAMIAQQLISWGLQGMGLNVPVEITKADYLAKKKAGTLNANTYYNVIDEYDSANVINDSSVTANSAFSSTKSEKTYAKKSTLVTTTLTASKWTGSSAPYTYVLPVSGATTSNIVEINYASNASSQAIEAYQNAMLADGGQTTNQITIKATEKPTVDIPITIVIRNDL